MALRTLSLCAGGGGLDLGLRLAVPAARTVCYVEHEAFACHRLVTAMQDGLLDDAPLWTNLKTFRGGPWRGVVDCVIAGWPCPPYSQAGRRCGRHDPRDLWPAVHRILAEVRPRLFFGENVAGFAAHPDGLARTVRDLTGLEYRVAATLVSATDVGASHERERCFVLGVADAERSELQQAAAGWADGAGGGIAASPGGELADATAPRRTEGRRGEHDDERREPRPECAPMADAAFPPGPADLDAWRRVLAANPLAGPAYSTRDLWLQAATEAGAWNPRASDEAQRIRRKAIGGAVRRMADELALANRARWLRLLGNGVVPLGAALALCALLARVEVTP